MRAGHDASGCFPTGRHYPGIADRIARTIRSVEGLAEEFDAATHWIDIPMAVLDFETTGRDAQTDRVLEIGIVLFDRGALTERISLLVDPGMPVPEESRAVHGITDEELSGAPRFDEVLPDVVRHLSGRLPVAYNSEFDRAFLHEELLRNRHAIPGDEELPPAMRSEVHWIDPLVWAREVLKDEKSRKLADVAAHFDVPLEQAHRAAGDAEATGRVLFALAPRMPKTYGELVRLQGRYAARQDTELAVWRRPS